MAGQELLAEVCVCCVHGLAFVIEGFWGWKMGRMRPLLVVKIESQSGKLFCSRDRPNLWDSVVRLRMLGALFDQLCRGECRVVRVS